MFSFVGELNLGWGLNGTFFIMLMILREILVVIHPGKFSGHIKPIYEMLFYAMIIAMIIFLRGEGSEFIYFQF